MKEAVNESLLTGERGSAMVELAIAAPVLLLLFCGSIEFGNMTGYKRKVIAASRYAAFEEVARKGENNLDQNVANEVQGLYFPELGAAAIVTSFGGATQTGVQVKVERDGSDDLGKSGALVYGKAASLAIQGTSLGPFSIGYRLMSNDDRVKTSVAVTYTPTFFPMLLGFHTLKESKTPTGGGTPTWDASKGGYTLTGNASPSGWDSSKNLFTLGGDKPFSRMAVLSGDWSTANHDQLVNTVKGMWCPFIGTILDKIGSMSLGIISFDCNIEEDLICPYTAPDWWKKDCKCDEDDSTVQNNGNSEDPTGTISGDKSDMQDTKAQVEQAVQNDQTAVTNDQNAVNSDNQALQNDQNNINNINQQIQQAQQNGQDTSGLQQQLQQAQQQQQQDQGQLSQDQGQLQQDQNQLQQDQDKLNILNGQAPPH